MNVLLKRLSKYHPARALIEGFKAGILVDVIVTRISKLRRGDIFTYVLAISYKALTK